MDGVSFSAVSSSSLQRWAGNKNGPLLQAVSLLWRRGQPHVLECPQHSVKEDEFISQEADVIGQSKIYRDKSRLLYDDNLSYCECMSLCLHAWTVPLCTQSFISIYLEAHTQSHISMIIIHGQVKQC